MRRAASLFLPSWSTDRLRKRDASLPREAPLVTALPDHSRRLIAAVDAAARKAGLVPGMTVTKARSLLPDLIVIDADPEDDLRGLRRLALWAGQRYAPVVAPNPPHGLLLDISGCESLFGGEDRLAKDLFRRVLASGLAVQLAVADTIGCAHAVARAVAGGRPSLIPPGKARAALSLLPVAALRIEPGVAADLARMGFTRIEQLIAAPRAPLAKRFGAGLHRRLDQALGHIPEPIEPIFPQAVPRVRRGLLKPIGTADAFAQVIHDLAQDLSAALITAGQGARRLDLFFHRVDGNVPTIRIGTATATRDPKHLAKLLCQKIDTIDPGLGVEAMTLVAPLVEPLGPAQASGLTASGRGPDLGVLVDALANRFGQRRLYRLVPDKADATTAAALGRLKALFGDRAYLALTIRRRPKDAIRLRDLAAQAAAAQVPTVATGDVLYHSPDRRMLQDVVSCIREKCTIDTLGRRRERFADRHLKTAAEMERLFARYLGDIAPVRRSVEIAKRCTFDLSDLSYTYPDEIGDSGLTPQAELERLTAEKTPERYPPDRYPGGVPPKVSAQIAHELKLIGDLGYAPYFLTVHAIVAYARSVGILCQGRGSAANSAVCFVLGITSIDPVQSELLFERFVSAERREPPDIDVDFEHERREEVIQWIYETYGRDRPALTAVITRFRAKGALADVGKALGLPQDMLKGLTSSVWGWSRDGVGEEQAAELNLDLTDRRLILALDLARQLIDTPRHTSQHPGGFVLTLGRLDELVPVEPAAMPDRQIIEWDKDDIDALGFMKVDVLGLGMLGCMRRAFALLETDKGIALDLATIPQEDPATYKMIQRADTLGTFQIESRAQMAMLPRIKPRTFYDLVVEVAIVRPGPIQGDMVHPYLRRREGKEPVSYPTPELRRVLEKTLGVPLFQEQAMRVAIECAGFTPSEADLLRRAMATFKLTGGVSHFRDKLIDGMVARGYAPDFAEQTFKQIEGFGSYGFPESHAASFALIAYASSWMKCHHPDVFCAALVNAQPMGFYPVSQIVRDAEQHGVAILPVDINHSRWDCTLEHTGARWKALRLGLRMVRDLKNHDAAAIVSARGATPFTSVEEVQRRAGIGAAALERIGQAGGFNTIETSRRSGLWAVKGLRDAPLPLFAAADERDGKLRAEAVEPEVVLARMGDGEEVVEDYRTLGLSLRAHPLSFLRAELTARKMTPFARLKHMKDGRWVDIAGIVTMRQRPGSAKGVMFITLGDETADFANLVIWPDLFEKHRRVVLGSSMMGIRGRLQIEGEVVHVIAQRLDDLSGLLASVGLRDGDSAPPDIAGLYKPGRGDGATHGGGPDPRRPKEIPLGQPIRDIFIPDLRLGSGIIPGQPTEGIKIKPRDFR